MHLQLVTTLQGECSILSGGAPWELHSPTIMTAEFKLHETVHVPGPISCCAFAPPCIFAVGSGRLTAGPGEYSWLKSLA